MTGPAGFNIEVVAALEALVALLGCRMVGRMGLEPRRYRNQNCKSFLLQGSSLGGLYTRRRHQVVKMWDGYRLYMVPGSHRTSRSS